MLAVETLKKEYGLTGENGHSIAWNVTGREKNSFRPGNRQKKDM